MIVLSDIHANLPALAAVLEQVGDAQVFFCGDLVGYYPWPDAVVDQMRDLDVIGVRGNHDEALVTESTFGFNSLAAEALAWTRDHISDSSREYLEELPYTRREDVEGADVFMAHGAPRRPVNEYVHPEQVDERFLEEQGVEPDVLLLGHTHVPFVRHVGDTLVVNPGSVGQPRDGDPRASYAAVDVEKREAHIHRISYDVDGVKEAVEEAGLPRSLGDRLEPGR